MFGFVVSRQTIADASINYNNAIAAQEKLFISHKQDFNKLKIEFYLEIINNTWILYLVQTPDDSFHSIMNRLRQAKAWKNIYDIDRNFTKDGISANNEIISSIDNIILLFKEDVSQSNDFKLCIEQRQWQIFEMIDEISKIKDKNILDRLAIVRNFVNKNLV
ncbi:MAG: hypothetical protein K1X68_03550 [Saprospiraceae bacterium]|nr:hypothetical protein [Saprospiraceae bacterium]